MPATSTQPKKKLAIATAQAVGASNDQNKPAARKPLYRP